MTEGSSAQAFWSAVAEVLRQRVSSADYMSWFASVQALDLGPDHLTLGVANDFAGRWIRERFTDVLEASVEAVAGQPLQIEFRSTAHAATDGLADLPEALAQTPPIQSDEITEDELRAELGNPRQVVEVRSAARIATNDEGERLNLELNPRYRFDTFVIGEQNQLAHAAALSVAESPGQTYNPLFIYGKTGLGKTHLLHAIGHYLMETQPSITVTYVTTETFINSFIQTLQKRSTGSTARQRFKEYFRGTDLLLVDDIQFLSGKGAALQEEFFHTFNALHETGRQVVLTSDCEPKSIPHLEDRLRSRFAWGLMVDVETPDRETRIAILRKKVVADGIDVPLEVLSMIGERITTNVRELEGALTRVVGLASLTGRPVTAQLAAQVMSTYAPRSSSEPLSIETIQEVVCDHFRVSRDELLGPRRSNDIARPRQIAMYLARVLLGATSTQVGQRFGGRDHSTVLHAERRIEELMGQDREVYDLVEELTTSIRQTGGRGVQQAR